MATIQAEPNPRVARTPWLISLGCALTLAGCDTPQQRISAFEDNLAAAGFIQRPANTPQRQSMLATLPAHQFVRRVQDDSVTYVYADPLVCACLYVGSQEAYGRLQAYLQQQRLANQQAMIAQTWSDARWNWGAWGPWGPAYGFGPGPGW
jgi:hypothetical protein